MPASRPAVDRPVPAVAIVGNDAVLAASPATPVQLAHACLRRGFSVAVPASWGDELVAAETVRRLAKIGKGPAVMCVCPLVRSRLLAPGPDLARFLVSLVSPPVAAARYLRTVYGDRGVHLTYIGACPSADDPSIDARLTPDAFLADLAEHGIALSEQPLVFDSIVPPDRRRWCSLPGGVPNSDVLANEIDARSVVEIESDDLATDLAQHIMAREHVLLDLAPSLRCACSGAVGTVPPARARANVSAAEPPRALSPVIDSAAVVSLDVPVGGGSAPVSKTAPRHADARPSVVALERVLDELLGTGMPEPVGTGDALAGSGLAVAARGAVVVDVPMLEALVGGDSAPESGPNVTGERPADAGAGADVSAPPITDAADTGPISTPEPIGPIEPGDSIQRPALPSAPVESAAFESTAVGSAPAETAPADWPAAEPPGLGATTSGVAAEATEPAAVDPTDTDVFDRGGGAVDAAAVNAGTAINTAAMNADVVTADGASRAERAADPPYSRMDDHDLTTDARSGPSSPVRRRTPPATMARYAAGSIPKATGADGRPLPRAYVAKRRTPPGGAAVIPVAVTRPDVAADVATRQPQPMSPTATGDQASDPTGPVTSATHRADAGHVSPEEPDVVSHESPSAADDAAAIELSDDLPAEQTSSTAPTAPVSPVTPGSTPPESLVPPAPSGGSGPATARTANQGPLMVLVALVALAVFVLFTLRR